MFVEIYDPRDESVRTRAAVPRCGDDFCDRCGDCLDCYGSDECTDNKSNGYHAWVLYVGDDDARIAELDVTAD